MKRVLLLLIVASCAGKSVRDISGRNPDADAGAFADVAPAPSARANRRDAGITTPVTRLAKGSARAIAIDEENVYFGSSDDDNLSSVPKKGGATVRLTRRAPVAGGLARDGGQLGWIATPGDVVLTMPVKGTVPTTVRERGIFVDIAMAGGEVYVAEVVPGGGAVQRIVNGGATRIASLDVAPRSVVVDGADVFIGLPSKIVKTTRGKSDLVTVANGTAVEYPCVTPQYVYFSHIVDNERVIARVPRAGGDAVTVVGRVAAAPFVVDGGEVFFFEGRRAEVRAISENGGQPRALANDDAFTRPNAIAVDKTTVFIAAGEREDGAILSIPR